MKINYFILLFLYTGITFAQQLKITGKITDAVSRNPIPEVHITSKDSNNNTKTYKNGLFEIMTSIGDQLEFSVVGYITQQIMIDANTSIVIVPLKHKTTKWIAEEAKIAEAESARRQVAKENSMARAARGHILSEKGCPERVIRPRTKREIRRLKRKYKKKRNRAKISRV